ncbi:unnamed protein product [Didymodactylos carnosus]|uniref:Uncharacterized protein n=1 Tax=Didymodactylos carnosus TaxID=1234261 RepID=A0A814IQ24_9BILA|nr:unnamed protein product [Didymodactylos carnosus]CAF1026944.1 unnamed protein product [Didymodactylos carnosus]CAF3636115.1 unnamed protein product [Didymodactylos carnosus]CAF3798036.1 unnamed protein product [Didymodactylos carnosus]
MRNINEVVLFDEEDVKQSRTIRVELDEILESIQIHWRQVADPDFMKVFPDLDELLKAISEFYGKSESILELFYKVIRNTGADKETAHRLAKLMVRAFPVAEPKEDSTESDIENRGGITLTVQVIKAALDKYWNDIPEWIQDDLNLDDVKKGVDKYVAISDTIEDMFYQIAKEQGANDIAAKAIAKVLMALLP